MAREGVRTLARINSAREFDPANRSIQHAVLGRLAWQRAFILR